MSLFHSISLTAGMKGVLTAQFLAKIIEMYGRKQVSTSRHGKWSPEHPEADRLWTDLCSFSSSPQHLFLWVGFMVSAHSSVRQEMRSPMLLHASIPASEGTLLSSLTTAYTLQSLSKARSHDEPLAATPAAEAAEVLRLAQR